MPRRPLTVLFAVYLTLLVWLVMWKLHEPFLGRADMRELKLVPFAGGGGYGANSPAEAIGNLLVFLPLGMYLAALAPGWRWWRVVGTAAALSLAFEIAQYVTAVGSSDVTDVVMNTAGGAAGFGLVILLRRALGSPRASALIARVLISGTLLAVLVAAATVATFPRLGAPHPEPAAVSWRAEGSPGR